MQESKLDEQGHLLHRCTFLMSAAKQNGLKTRGLPKAKWEENIGKVTFYKTLPYLKIQLLKWQEAEAYEAYLIVIYVR